LAPIIADPAWRRRPGSATLVDWRERDVEMTMAAAAPQGGGYGRELIERALPYQLNADTAYDLTPMASPAPSPRPLPPTATSRKGEGGEPLGASVLNGIMV
jgi:hypothetical protein